MIFITCMVWSFNYTPPYMYNTATTTVHYHSLLHVTFLSSDAGICSVLLQHLLQSSLHLTHNTNNSLLHVLLLPHKLQLQQLPLLRLVMLHLLRLVTLHLHQVVMLLLHQLATTSINNHLLLKVCLCCVHWMDYP